jgi:chemotaxis signal transduction protein
MTEAVLGERSAAERLTDAFDQGFAVAARAVNPDVDALLGIAVRGEPYAVRLGEITALLADRRVVPLPGPSLELLGLTGVRGNVVPVYDLGALLGHAPLTVPGRYLLVAGTEHPVGLSFERFDGYVEVPRSEISLSREHEGRSHCREVARLGDKARAVILIHSILGTITERVAASRGTRER